MKKILKRLIILFVAIFAFITFNQKVDATSISFSNNSPKVGEAVTVTVSVPNVNTVALTANVTGPGINTQIKVVNGDMSGNKNTFSNSATVTPTAEGTITVSVTSDSNAVADGNYVDVSGSATASVTAATSAPDNPSGDSGNSNPTPDTSTPPAVTAPTLSNLGINPHDFSGFKSGTTSYQVTVPNDCKSVTIYATSNNGEISGTGAVTLKEGTNKFNVTVSNSAGSKTYTLSIIRQTQDSEVIPNTIEGEEPENNSEGIGLTGLRITGYTFEEEFQTGTYEYTVKIPEGLSESELEEIKNSITAITNDDKVSVEIQTTLNEDGSAVIITNDDKVSVEIQTTLNEDGSAVITLVVKDDEKEYSTYKINFIIDKEAVNNESSEKTEKTSAVAGITKSNNSQGKTAVEEIKNSITAITNDDKVSVEIQTTLNEDGSAVIIIL